MRPYPFAGTVIDGPDRGKSIVQPKPEYRVQGPLPPIAYRSCQPNMEVPVSINAIHYRWSYSLGQWAMVY